MENKQYKIIIYLLIFISLISLIISFFIIPEDSSSVPSNDNALQVLRDKTGLETLNFDYIEVNEHTESIIFLSDKPGITETILIESIIDVFNNNSSSFEKISVTNAANNIIVASFLYNDIMQIISSSLPSFTNHKVHINIHFDCDDSVIIRNNSESINDKINNISDRLYISLHIMIKEHETLQSHASLDSLNKTIAESLHKLINRKNMQIFIASGLVDVLDNYDSNSLQHYFNNSVNNHPEIMTTALIGFD